VKVLVVDDDRTSRRLFELFLKRAQVECITAENASDALESYKKHRPEMIVTDWFMPGESGPELAQKIRKMRIARGVFIACLSGFDTNENAAEASAAGIDLFVPKPLDSEKVVQLLKIAARVLEIQNSTFEELAANRKTSRWGHREFEILLNKVIRKARKAGLPMGLVAGRLDPVRAESIKEILRNSYDAAFEGRDYMLSVRSANFVTAVFPASQEELSEYSQALARYFRDIDAWLDPVIATAMLKPRDSNCQVLLSRVIREVSRQK
jgi:CheY-like chemotaxis protein